jgi:Na+-driven multidrug efflux pump
MSFLYTGTTSIMAASRTKDRETSKAGMIGALQLSLLVGAVIGVVLFIFTKPILYYMIGNDAIGADVFESAARYVRIRALGMPAAALIGSAQAACLGLQDVRSPLLIISIAAIVNLVFDVMLVGSPSRWIGGAAGASWATTIAQYSAAGLFLKWLWSPATESDRAKPPSPLGKIWKRYKVRFQGPSKPKANKSMSTRGFLAEEPLSSLISPPSKATEDEYRPFVLPVTMTQVGRCAVYVAMGHAVSSCFGTTSMAAQQIICSVFYTLIPIADSLSLTAQSFLPSIFQQEPSMKRSNAMRQTTWNLAKAAALFGVVLSSIAGLLPIGVRLFTTDASVTALVNSIVPVLMAVFLFHGVFCGSEGILLAQKDLTFLGRMYGAYFVVVPYLMMRVKWAALAGKKVQLRSVWNVFLGYQAFRISAWVLRVVWLQRKSDKEAIGLSSNDGLKTDDDAKEATS